MARPRIRCADLPIFSGIANEWLSFRAAYQDSTRIYQISANENLQRLRSCLRGEARNVVAGLLHAATDPDVVMKTLEQCFGRPEVIIDQAFLELKKLPRPGSSAVDLNSFAVKVQSVVSILNSIGRQGYLYNPMLAREVLDKLSPHIRARWCDYSEEHEVTLQPEIVVLSRFLMREADRALKHAYAPPMSVSTPAATRRETRPSTNTGNQRKKMSAVYNVTEAEEEQVSQCPSCEQTHALPQCPKYKGLSLDERWELVKEKKLCFKCITKKHRRSNCKAKLCGVNECRSPHHPTLHREEKTPKPLISETEAVLSVATKATVSTQAVLLKMCPVTVVGPRGEEKTYALLDEGATITLIDEELAKKIGAKGPLTPLHMHGVNMTQHEEDSRLVTVHLEGKDGKRHKLRARTIKNMKLHQQSIPSALLKQEHLRDLPREEVCYDQAHPGILVGTDHWEYIVSRELRVGGPNQPAASRTQLGWVVHGTAPRSVIHNQDGVLHVFTVEPGGSLKEQQDQRLHDLVEEHFRIDALGIAHKSRVSEVNSRATKIVEQTLKKVEGGYQVGLPWKQDDIKMPPSFDAALRRLTKIEQKMDAAPAFAKEYTKQIENLLAKGYAVPCNGTERSSPVCWYLPHFAVQNPNKPGRQRLVFDAAAKSRGVSLNDYLLEGPDLLTSLQGILFRFRERPVAITADIQEMFLQVKIRPEDQPAQQFLWRGADRDNPPRHYKMTSMIFGAASSPFMAHYVRKHNAQEHAQTHPRALEAITRSHYMDDLVASYDTTEEARRAIQETREVHAAAGFTLRGWNANAKEVIGDVPTQLRATSPTRLGGDGPENKILGLYWDAERDELGFNTSMNRVPAEVRAQTRPPTKREALSAVMSLYDPLGLLSHYTIRAKIILQSLWRMKMEWDEPIPAEENEMFEAWLRQLPDLTCLRLERCYALEGYQGLELHIFCDASEQAYSAVAYWRVTRPNGAIAVSLVTAKAKVAPRRTQTIPRLELQAAVIGARLAETIKKEHRVEVQRTMYWTGSTTVIHWIRHDARRYTPFVAHRLGELAELTQPEDWRWVPTSDNVADDATRFAHTRITSDDRWFRGPEFLRQPEELWPVDERSTEEEEVLLHVTTEDQQGDEWLPDPARFSKFETLVRAAARVLVFVDKCRRRATGLEHRHIEKAERALIRRAQKDSFREELLRMKASHPLPKASRLFRLDPVLEEGILRVRGRIGAATAPLEVKRPIILDGRHRITKLIVLREHCAAGHANRERVTNDLRQRYWIIHLRPTVRTIERECALCRTKTGVFKRPVTKLVVLVKEEARSAAPGGELLRTTSNE
ncbi:unnamed protein product, partial [Brenthis ino]